MAKKVDPKGKGKDAGKSAKTAPSKGVKAKKKSWTKVKVKDKLNNAVFLDAKSWENISKTAPKLQALTVSIIADKYKVNGSVARRILTELHSKGLIRQAGDHHSKFTLYAGTQYAAKAPEPVKGAKAQDAKAAKGAAKDAKADAKDAKADAKVAVE